MILNAVKLDDLIGTDRFSVVSLSSLNNSEGRSGPAPGPKDQHSIATSVRAWVKNLKGDERRRCGTVSPIPISAGPPGLSHNTGLAHALTDVATKCRSFGPGAMPLLPRTVIKRTLGTRQ